MLPTVEESIVSIFASASFLDTLPFHETKKRLADQALTPAELFEGTYIRDAEEHELGLFSTEESLAGDGLHAGAAGSSAIDHHSAADRDDRARHRRSLLGRSTSGSTTSRSQHVGNNASNGLAGARNAWNFPKSRGPARIGAPEKATPLKKRRAQPAQNKNAIDPEAYLLAARKLLQTYPMQRASEHVELLYSQYEGLMEAIADLEESLHQPPPKASTSALTIEASAEDDLASLEADIRREELEILALKEARKELDQKARQLHAKTASSMPMQNRTIAARTASGRPAPQSVKMPSIKDAAAKSTVRTSATTASTTSNKRVPAVVARRMAEQKAAAGTASATNKASSPPATTATTPPKKETPASVIPALNVQSPSNTSLADQKDEDEDDDQTIVLGGRTGVESSSQAVEDGVPLPAKPILQPRIPPEQMDKVLTRIVSVLPGNIKKTVSKDAESVLSGLSTAISRAEGGTASPTSSVSTSSITASPTSSSLTPVNIIELHLLHTFLTLLVSLDLEASTNSKEKVNLILRKPIASSIGTPGNENSGPEAFLNMNNLKIFLGAKAKEKGLNEDLGHKAIYGLVAKKVLKIDRKGREALVCFCFT